MSLAITFVAVTAVVCLTTVFVVTIPVSNSIETATDGISTIYNGAIVLIGGLLAYRIGWHYIGYSFSVSGALEKALEKMKSTKVQNPRRILHIKPIMRGYWPLLVV